MKHAARNPCPSISASAKDGGSTAGVDEDDILIRSEVSGADVVH